MRIFSNHFLGGMGRRLMCRFAVSGAVMVIMGCITPISTFTFIVIFNLKFGKGDAEGDTSHRKAEAGEV